MSDLGLHNAILKTYPGAQFILEGDQVTHWNHTEPFDMSRVSEEMILEEQLRSSKQELYNKIVSLADSLTRRSKELLSGKAVDAGQQERYNAKREAVLVNNVAFFNDEATLTGKDPQVLFDEAKVLANAWTLALNTVLGKIDAIRVKLNTMLDGAVILEDFDNVKSEIEFYIEKLYTQTISPTTDIIAIFDTLNTEYVPHVEELKSIDNATVTTVTQDTDYVMP